MNDYFLRLGRRRYDYNPDVHGVFLDKLVSEEFWGVQVADPARHFILIALLKHQWSSCAFHPSVSSEHLAVLGDEDGNIGVVDVRKASQSSEYTVDDDDYLCPSWLVKSRKFTGTSTNERRLDFRGHDAVVMDVTFLAEDSRRFVSVSGDETVKVWDSETSQELFCLTGHTKTVRGLASWKNNPHSFATGGRDGTICVWDIREAPGDHCIAKEPSDTILEAHMQTSAHADVGLPPKTPTRKRPAQIQTMPNVTSLVYIDDSLLVSGSSTVESGLGVWDLRCSGQLLAKPLRVYKFPSSKLGRGKGIASLCIDRNRFGLYAAATDGSVHEFLLNDLKWRSEFDGSLTRMVVPRTNVRRNRAVNARREFTGWSKNGFYAQLAASPITDHIMCSYGDGLIRIWNTKETSPKISPSHSLPGHSGEVTALSWSSTGNGEVTALSWSSTGKYVLAVDDRKPVLWSCCSESSEVRTPSDGSRRCTVQRHEKPVHGTNEFLMGRLRISQSPPRTKRKQAFSSPFKNGTRSPRAKHMKFSPSKSHSNACRTLSFSTPSSPSVTSESPKPVRTPKRSLLDYFSSPRTPKTRL
uniref:WD_REPEATS_REGION domain-containing protein n=1 Tax=Steinernema glaseri TaxID=37863 RepID=A0A1I7ZYY2_9BILA